MQNYEENSNLRKLFLVQMMVSCSCLFREMSYTSKNATLRNVHCSSALNGNWRVLWGTEREQHSWADGLQRNDTDSPQVQRSCSLPAQP